MQIEEQSNAQHVSGTVTADVESEPVTVFAKVMRGGLPVLGASAEAEVYFPGEDLGQSLGDGLVHKIILRDDGLGKWSHIGAWEMESSHLSSISPFPMSLGSLQMVNLDKNIEFSSRRWLAFGLPPESLLQAEKLLWSNGLLVSQHKSSLPPCQAQLSHDCVSQPSAAFLPPILWSLFTLGTVPPRENNVIQRHKSVTKSTS